MSRDHPYPVRKPPARMHIATKLQMPPLKAGMPARKHLVDRLFEGRHSRLIAICGEAGSGKTSLVCQWIKECAMPAAWYSLDSADNEVDVFLRYLLTSLIDLHANLAVTLNPWLHGQRKLTGSKIIPLVIEQFVDLKEHVYVVLDDYHFITSKEVHATLSFLLNYMPEKMHAVIVSRKSIPFPISRLKVRGQVTEISSTDMRFTEEETARFFAGFTDLELSSEQIHELARQTEGWVGGLQLVALSLKGKRVPDDLNGMLSGARQDIAQYLIEEVIGVQSKKVRSFLTKTSLLDRFNADLCKEVTGRPEAAEILEYAYRNNIFVIPLDRERTWYRYHHLFSDIVRRQIKKSLPNTFEMVQKKAALWFAERGYLEDAFRHAFGSGDHDFAADLLEDHMLQLFQNCEILSGLRWFSKVPQEAVLKRPLLRLHACGFQLESLQLPEMEALLKDIEDGGENVFDRYDDSKKRLCRDLFIYFRYVLPHFNNPGDADVNELNELMGRFSSDGRPMLSCFILLLTSEHYIHRGDPGRAIHILGQASTVTLASENLWETMMQYKLAATAELLQGRLQRVEVLVQEAFLFLEDRGLADMPYKFLLYLPMAWVYYYRNDLEKALEYATAGLEHVQQLRSVALIINGNALLSLLYHGVGNRGKSIRHMAEMQRVSEAVDNPRMVALVDWWFAYLRMVHGNLASAAQWADRRRLDLSEPFSTLFVRECLTLAVFLVREGSYPHAVSVLESLRHRCAKRNLMEAVLHIDLLLSASFHALGNHSRAVTVMGEALAFSETEEFSRPFVDFAGLIAPVLASMTRDGGNSHLAAVTKACNISVCDGGIGANLGLNETALLTGREIEILGLVAAGYKNREIADKLFISLATVKTHNSHIFEKLEVSNRGEAIRRAEDLHLLETNRV